MPASSRHHRHDLPKRAHGVFLSACIIDSVAFRDLLSKCYCLSSKFMPLLSTSASLHACLPGSGMCGESARRVVVALYSCATHCASRSGQSRSRGHLPVQLFATGLLVGEKPPFIQVYVTRVGDRTLRLKTCTVQSARSTYLNQRFRYVLGQAGDCNLALSCEWECRSSGSLRWPCAFGLLCDTSSWCDNGGGRSLRFGGSLACW